jgi:hypothetical protein
LTHAALGPKLESSVEFSSRGESRVARETRARPLRVGRRERSPIDERLRAVKGGFMRSGRFSAVVWTFVALVLACAPAIGGECTIGGYDAVTDDFFYSATSHEGAVGDVIGVEVALTVEALHGEAPRFFSVVASYDDAKADLLGLPIYSSFYLDFGLFPMIRELDGIKSLTGRKGFGFDSSIQQQGRQFLEETIAGGGPALVPLFTVYFRLKGAPGDAFQIRFADDEFAWVNGSCIMNQVNYNQLYVRSTRHVHGEIGIIEGEPTHPEAPPLPPAAKVYAEAPTPEEADITFELTGGTVHPGQKDFPVDFYITANYEFTGYALAVTFPPEHLEVTRMQDHILPGGMFLDNPRGHVSLAQFTDTRRLGAEGERVLAATLYFNVKEAAAEASRIEIKIETFEREPGMAVQYINWLGIRYNGGTVADPLPVDAQVDPLAVGHALLAIVVGTGFVRGDCNGDGTPGLSDAVFNLGMLFREEGVAPCREACDSNGDSLNDISDAIHLLMYLFLGGRAPPAPFPGCGEDPDPDASLGCEMLTCAR